MKEDKQTFTSINIDEPRLKLIIFKVQIYFKVQHNWLLNIGLQGQACTTTDAPLLLIFSPPVRFAQWKCITFCLSYLSLDENSYLRKYYKGLTDKNAITAFAF